MRKHAENKNMNSFEFTHSEVEAKQSFYSRVWEKASTFVVAVAGDLSKHFSAKSEKDEPFEGTSPYVSRPLQGVKGNWKIITPKAAEESTSKHK